MGLSEKRQTLWYLTAGPIPWARSVLKTGLQRYSANLQTVPGSGSSEEHDSQNKICSCPDPEITGWHSDQPQNETFGSL